MPYFVALFYLSNLIKQKKCELIFSGKEQIVSPLIPKEINDENFSIDYDSLEKLINHQIDGGVDYLVVMGTTGESVVLSKQEKKQVVNFCKKVNNARLPIVLGVGSNNTFALVEEIKSTDFDGIDAVLSVSPYYNKPSQDGIYLHYKMIAEVCPLPIISYL